MTREVLMPRGEGTPHRNYQLLTHLDLSSYQLFKATNMRDARSSL